MQHGGPAVGVGTRAVLLLEPARGRIATLPSTRLALLRFGWPLVRRPFRGRDLPPLARLFAGVPPTAPPARPE